MSETPLHANGPTAEALFAVAVGRIHPEAADWVAAHVQTCATCTAALQRVRAVHGALEPPPEAPFDRARDLAAVRRRLERPAPRRARRWWLAGVPAAALLVGAALFVGGRWRAPRPDQAALAQLRFSVVERVGAATVRSFEGVPATLNAQEDLGAGVALEVPLGGRVVANWGGARVVVDGKSGATRVRLLASRASSRRLELSEGRVLLDVQPLGVGQELAVITGDGEVSVHGTVFSVEKTARGTGAAVTRGRVAVKLASRTVFLDAGRQLLPGAEAASDIAPEARDALGGVTEVGGVERASNTLDVFADVPEAQVAVDGLVRGTAPVSLTVSTGVHRVRVSAAGYQIVEERIEVREGVPTLFRAELRSDKPAPAASAHSERVLPVAQVLRAARADMIDGRSQQAVHALEALLKRGLAPSERARVLSTLGQAERLALQPERAATHFAAAAQLDGPEAEHAQLLLAQTYGRDLGDAHRAAAAWSGYERRFPRGLFAPEVAFRLGEALLAAGETREGIAQLERYLNDHPAAPHVSEAHLLVGAARRDRLSDCNGALGHFQAVSHEHSGRGETALVAEARCLNKLGRKNEAQAAYRQYLRNSPDGAFVDEAERALRGK